MALPANQSEVHKNCAMTMMGNMRFGLFMELDFFCSAFEFPQVIKNAHASPRQYQLKRILA